MKLKRVLLLLGAAMVALVAALDGYCYLQMASLFEKKIAVTAAAVLSDGGTATLWIGNQNGLSLTLSRVGNLTQNVLEQELVLRCSCYGIPLSRTVQAKGPLEGRIRLALQNWFEATTASVDSAKSNDELLLTRQLLNWIDSRGKK